MAKKSQLSQWLKSQAGIIAAAVCGLTLMTVPVVAQWGGFGQQGGGWGQQQRGGNFDSFFSPFQAPQRSAPSERADYSRAPSPRKPDTAPSGGTVLVLGDSMADWLAYGLEDALGDTPDLGVVRKNRATSGLIRYDSRNETQDWAQVIREAIAANKPKYIVMMVGLNDRVSIRERVAAPAANLPGGKAAPAAAPPAAAAPAAPPAGDASKPDAADAEQSPPEPPTVVAAPEPQQKAGPTTTKTYEFMSEEWEAYYVKRIDATIAALKSAGVPVFWVGLPSIRGTKSTTEMQYLDDLYRGRVEKAGITFIDVWDGFVDESGRFIVQGADFEGQTRRLRAGDGVHFTKPGARKLAHYLEREIRRVMAPGAEVVALPSSDPLPATPAGPAKPSGPAQRPMAGPVVPLTTAVASGQELLGGKNDKDPEAAQVPKSVTRVLVNGDAITPPAGRADDFAWPRRGIAPVGADPVVATTTEPIPVMKPAPETTVAAPSGDVRPVAAVAPAPRRVARPAQTYQPFRTNNFFSFFR